MALHIIEDPSVAGTGSPVFADRPLYTNADGTKLVEEGDEDAAILIASHAGKPIPVEYVTSLGLQADKDGKVSQKQRAASGDKERRSGRDKGAPDQHDATPPEDDGRSADPVVSVGAGAFASMSKAQLKKLAKDRGVPGYGGMNEKELAAALAEGGAMQAGGSTPG